MLSLAPRPGTSARAAACPGVNRFKVAALLLSTALLGGCLQIELYGPVSLASISISPLRGGPAVVAGLRSDSPQASAARWGAQKWARFAPTTQLWLLGGASVPSAGLQDTTLYLVTASGGRDLDYNEDRQADAIGRQIRGRWHAVASGAQLKLPLVRISVLTEALYQTLRPELAELTDAQAQRRLDELARQVVGDINNDGNNDYLDVLSWTTMVNAQQYKGADVFLERLRHDVEWDLGASILADDGINLVQKAAWQPALSGGPFAETLIGCATPVLVRDLCQLQKLPVLGSVTAAPTVEDIMQRLVVSHAWIAARFEQVLRNMPAELILMMRSLTGVVIGANVRPSYYSPATSMIYLDAEQFWLTDAERDTISTAEDYRAEFSRQFVFAGLWRYVRGSENAFADEADVDGEGNRELEQTLQPAAALLFHELAHANDHVPSHIYHILNPFQTLYDQFYERLSDRLNTRLPLQSAQLLNLASALFHGSTPTTQEKAYSADAIGRLFDPDGANDLYAYSSQHEDLAMLLEEFMMRRHYGLQRDIAFTTNPEEDAGDALCEDFLVRWGVRGRIGAAQLRPRLQQILRDLLPEQEFSREVAQLPVPVRMRNGVDWCENLALHAAAIGSGRATPQGTAEPAPAPDRRPRPYL